MKNRTYRYMEKEALYPFGFGLSYTSFALRDVKLSSEKIAADSEIKVSAKIKNTGAVAGGETVQVYVKFSGAAGGTLSVPNFQLKGLRKMYLEPGEEKEAEVTLDARAFALYNEEADLVLEKGVYTVYVGTQQPDKRSAALTGGEPVCLTVSAEKTEKL